MESITKNVLEKLNDTSVDFATRCNIAHRSLGLIDNEELILEWIASNCKKPRDDYARCLELLLKCLESQHLSSLVKIVSPESCLNFLKKAQKFQSEVELQIQVRDATNLIMSIPCFQLYFKNNVNSLAKSVGIYYSAIEVCGHSENKNCGDCPELLTHLYNETLLKEDFVIQFLDYMMPAVFSMPDDTVCSCSTSHHMNELMSQMFFKDPRILAEVLTLDKYLTDPDQLPSDCPTTVKALVRTITQSVVTVSDQAMATFYSSFLDIFQRNKQSFGFKLFISLAAALGFKFEQERIQLQYKVDGQKRLNILLAMLCTMNKNNRYRDYDENISNWLVSLLKLIMSPTYGLSKYTLVVIQATVCLMPIVALKVIPEFVQYVMMPQKDANTKQLYIELLVCIMDIFVTLTQMNKMLDEMIEVISIQAATNPIIIPPCSIMLPKKFFPLFEPLVKNMSNLQIPKVIACLLTHLDKKIAEPLTVYKEKIDIGQLTILEFVTVILECILRNVTFTKKEQYQLLAFMASILQKLGNAMIAQTFNVTFSNLFLKLCRVWGDCIIIIKNYDDSDSFEDIMTDHIGRSIQIEDEDSINNWTNISYTFKFLSEQKWKIIGERVQRFASKQSTDDLCTIVLQNLNALKVADILIQEKSDCTIKELSQIARPKWLWLNLNTVISFVYKEKTMLQLAEVLTDVETTSALLLIQSDIVFRLQNSKVSDRMLMSSLALSWLRKIAIVLNNLGMNKTHELLPSLKIGKAIVASEVAYGSFLDVQINDNYQHSETLSSVVSDKMKLAKQSDKMSNQLLLDIANVNTVEDIGEDDFENIKMYLHHMRSFKITTLSPPFCRIVLLTLLSIVNEFNQQNRKPPAELFGIITDIFSNHIHIVGDLWLNKTFFQWLYASYSTHPKKKEAIFSLALDFIVKNPKANEIIETLACNEDLMPLVLLSCIKQKQNCKRKREEDVQHAIDELLNRVIEVFFNNLMESIQNNGVQRKHLHIYCLLLKHYVHMKNQQKILDFSQYLVAFYDIVVSSVSDPTVTNISHELLFIEIIYSCRTLFQDKLQQGTHLALWTLLSTKAKCVPASKHGMKVLLEAFTVDEYSDVLEAMKNGTLQNNVVDTNLVELNKAWKVIIQTKVNAEKIKKWIFYKEFLEQELSSLAGKWITDPPDTAQIVAVFSVLRSMVSTPSIRIGPENLDVIFLLMTVMPPNDLVAAKKGVNLLVKLLSIRSVVVLMHMPSFLQRYRFFISYIVKASCNDFDKSKDSDLYSCTLSVNTLSVNIAYFKEFTPSIPNLIADIMHLLEAETTVHPTVKESLVKVTSGFLNRCSQKNIDYLMQSLSPASREIFKLAHKRYELRYKYRGKV